MRLRNNGNGVGRPVTIEVNDNFISVYNQWKDDKITAVTATKLCNMTKPTFYRKVKEYESK